MLLFGTFIGLVFRTRTKPALHKRLVPLSVVDPVVAGIARWPFPFVFQKIAVAAMISCGFLVLLAAYDLLLTHRVRLVTL